LPDVPVNRRRDAADRWLIQQGADDPAARLDVIEQALRVIEAPAFAGLFGPDALAEAPIAAVVGEAVIAGTVDRLCIGVDRVQLVDFKTGRIAPQSPDQVPLAHVRQMAAYVAALEVIFPNRAIEAGLLYTGGPHLVIMPPHLLAAHKPGFVPTQENLPLWPVEPEARPS
ncbi:PD-(D/E)XK nuclease family protein, partial [Sphingobium sp.]|uniref:PD-(D/E)XK nuclease family protein n=1 Tax=Sphingobium sp. TaxID=1912891 RepID=UPI002CC6866F